MMIRTNRLLLRKRTYDELATVLDHLRKLYNAALEQRILAYRRQGKSLSLYDQCKDLTALRADSDYGIYNVEMTRLTVLRRLDLAFHAFFRRLKTGQKPGFPRFKGRDRFDTLVFGPTGWSLKGKRLKLHGIGTFSVVGSLYRSGKPKGLRIKRVADRWEVQILMGIGEAPAIKVPTNSVGIDVGIRTFATLSNGEQVEHPKFIKQAAEALRETQQRISSKRRGSRRRQRAKLILSKLHRRVANRRQDFLHQTTRRLINSYDGFAVEQLDIQEMVQSTPEEMTPKQARGLRRGVMDSAWSTFMFQLGYKAEEAGIPIVRVDPRGTSQRCSGCGSVVRKTLRDRQHACPACGLVLDRDLNAAVNIHDLGWRSAGGFADCKLSEDACGGSR